MLCFENKQTLYYFFLYFVQFNFNVSLSFQFSFQHFYFFTLHTLQQREHALEISNFRHFGNHFFLFCLFRKIREYIPELKIHVPFIVATTILEKCYKFLMPTYTLHRKKHFPLDYIHTYGLDCLFSAIFPFHGLRRRKNTWK